MTSSAVTVGLVGFGWFAELLASRVFPNVLEIRVVAVPQQLSPRRERAGMLLKVPVFENIASMLRGSNCQAVVIMTLHNTHRELVEAAAASGRHIFCEKAMADDSGGLRRYDPRGEIGEGNPVGRPHAKALSAVRSRNSAGPGRRIRKAPCSERVWLSLVSGF